MTPNQITASALGHILTDIPDSKHSAIILRKLESGDDCALHRTLMRHNYQLHEDVEHRMAKDLYTEVMYQRSVLAHNEAKRVFTKRLVQEVGRLGRAIEKGDPNLVASMWTHHLKPILRKAP